MTAQQYLEGLLAEQKLRDAEKELKNIRQEIEGVLRKKYKDYPIDYYYGGSYGKKTIIQESFDLDIIIYFPHTYPRQIRDIYNQVGQTLCNAKYQVKRKKESAALQVKIPWKPGFTVDVVPAKAKDETCKYANLYQHGKNLTKRTSRIIHIGTVKDSNCRPIIKLMKLWKIRHNIENWKSFCLEMTVIKALKGYRKKKHYDKSLSRVFKFIQQEEITDMRVVDPANCNNVIQIPESTYNGLKKAAAKSINLINAGNWKNVIW